MTKHDAQCFFGCNSLVYDTTGGKYLRLSVSSAAIPLSTIQDIEKALDSLHVKALEVQLHDLSGATDMVLKLGVKQFYTASVAFSSPSERDAGTKILKEHFKLPGYCARVTSCTVTKPRSKGSLSVHCSTSS